MEKPIDFWLRKGKDSGELWPTEKSRGACRSYCFLPAGDGVVEDILRKFGDHRRAEFVLDIRQKHVRVIGLIRAVGLVKRVLGVHVVREMDRNRNGQFALRSVAVSGDGALRNGITRYLAFYLQVAAFAQHLQTRLALEEVAYAFRESVAESRVHERGVVREVGNRDSMGRLVVDVRSVHLIADRAGRHNQANNQQKYAFGTIDHTL